MDIDHLVAAAQARYVAAHPVSRRWWERAMAVMPGGNTRTVLHVDPFPIRVTQAEGKYLHDAEGHTYVDLLGNYTAGLFGHSPVDITDAIHKAVDRGIAYGAVHEDEVRLAELIVGRFPSIEQVRFTNSGTEANLMAIATALHHIGRSGVLVFDGGYHGGVLTFGSKGRQVNVPHRWSVARFNDLASCEPLMSDPVNDIGCVVVEPMQGSSGCIPAEPGFLEGLRELCDRHGAVLVFDEVMTSRLSPGGMQKLTGVLPDMTTLGKYLAGGMTFGAFGGRRPIMAAYDPATGGELAHAGTFNNNVVSMAAGVAAIGSVLDDERLAALNARGDRLRAALDEALAPVGMCATGIGSILTVHPVPGPVRSVDDLAGGDERLRELWFFASLAAGFYVARRGFIALSLEISDDDVERYVAAVAAWAGTLAT
ncbi:MAG: aspartate aminotransferase family protein [Acidimicrobiia bacterium]